MNNADLAQLIFSFLKKVGVDTIVVCAGARNAPLVLQLENQNFKKYHFFEERSAAFFALGRIKASSKPAAIMTTSGTATAELLPATIEAFYQGAPLLLITADRPRMYRGTGAPQTINQVGLYSEYVEKVYDLDVSLSNCNIEWSLRSPLHLNVSFDEPLIDETSSHNSVITFAQNQYLFEHSANNVDQLIKQNFSKPLIILGEIPKEYSDKVKNFLVSAKAPIYAETASLVKDSKEFDPYLITSSEKIVSRLLKEKICNSVIRLGRVPTLRLWRDLEKEFSHIPVANFSDLIFSGLARSSLTLHFNSLPITNTGFLQSDLMRIKEVDKSLQSHKKQLFLKYPESEQNFTNTLAQLVQNEPIYLGNSMPIRYWDEFSCVNSFDVAANRGANGIDGQISTYLGWSEKFARSYCYVGDLTAMYDLAALGLTKQLRFNSKNIFIMNNFGGQIFKKVFKSKYFINEHNVQFKNWAEMWGWNYRTLQSRADFEEIEFFDGNTLFEMRPENQQTASFTLDWETACQKINF